MAKKIIALQGKSNVGKSTTLYQVYQLLAANSNVKCVSFKALGWKIDFIAIVLIAGVKVGIVSRGDTPKILTKLLIELRDEGCNIIVCAARTKGGTSKIISAVPGFKDVEALLKEACAIKVQGIANSSMAHLLVSKTFSSVLQPNSKVMSSTCGSP